MEIEYERLESSIVRRTIKPVDIMFSEFYFYLAAFIENIDCSKFRNEDDAFPTIYRIDRIKSFEVTDRVFDIPYRDRFEEGEFRNRIHFIYKGINPEAVLDRLPTAKIISHDSRGFEITAEVFGDGVDMWLRSQGDYIEII